jgi:2-haloacid dehalogenase
MGTYVDVWAVTESALRYTMRRLGLHASETELRRLMEAYLSLAPFPEVPAALARLAGRPRAVLSNGAPSMLAAAVASSGLAAHLEHVISVDAVRTYKPSPRVYALGPGTLGIPASELLFVSSNGWDVAGGKAFGFQVIWVNRQGAPLEELGVTPDLEVRDLQELAQALGR